MSKLSKDLTAASSIPLILSILDQGESYGYEIIQQVSLLSKGTVQWKDGMLYPVLHKMEKRGLVTSSWKTVEGRRKRKYYTISDKGKQQLVKDQTSWNLVTSMFDQLWNHGKVSM
ncbi:MAG: PadR family transcriptional regulator [Saprospiraceae bacterium]|nr:PadR family transcriptional regulator [Saprospiraceae bacterium]